MKRSEMVKNLATKGLEFSTEIENSSEYESMSVREYSLKLTDKLLVFLEEQGMLPPKGTFSDDSYDQYIEFTENKWEPENET